MELSKQLYREIEELQVKELFRDTTLIIWNGSIYW